MRRERYATCGISRAEKTYRHFSEFPTQKCTRRDDTTFRGPNVSTTRGRTVEDMTVNDPTLASLGSSGAARSQETGNTQPAGRPTAKDGPLSHGSDDVHLSELVRSLRSLASESPERQERIEELARSYTSGSYQVNAEATAAAIISDALLHQ